MFFSGQRVVCVEPTNDLVKGRTYKVLRVCVIAGLEFLEVDQTEYRCPAFYARRFRPLDERKTDISAFTKLLNPTTESVDA